MFGEGQTIAAFYGVVGSVDAIPDEWPFTKESGPKGGPPTAVLATTDNEQIGEDGAGTINYDDPRQQIMDRDLQQGDLLGILRPEEQNAQVHPLQIPRIAISSSLFSPRAYLRLVHSATPADAFFSPPNRFLNNNMSDANDAGETRILFQKLLRENFGRLLGALDAISTTKNHGTKTASSNSSADSSATRALREALAVAAARAQDIYGAVGQVEARASSVRDRLRFLHRNESWLSPVLACSGGDLEELIRNERHPGEAVELVMRARASLAQLPVMVIERVKEMLQWGERVEPLLQRLSLRLLQLHDDPVLLERAIEAGLLNRTQIHESLRESQIGQFSDFLNQLASGSWPERLASLQAILANPIYRNNHDNPALQAMARSFMEERLFAFNPEWDSLLHSLHFIRAHPALGLDVAGIHLHLQGAFAECVYEKTYLEECLSACNASILDALLPLVASREPLLALKHCPVASPLTAHLTDSLAEKFASLLFQLISGKDSAGMDEMRWSAECLFAQLARDAPQWHAKLQKKIKDKIAHNAETMDCF